MSLLLPAHGMTQQNSINTLLFNSLSDTGGELLKEPWSFPVWPLSPRLCLALGIASAGPSGGC